MNARTSVFPAKAGTQNLSHKREVSQRPSAYAKNAERGLYPPPPIAAKTRFQLGRSLFVKGLGPRLRGEHGKKGNKAPIPGLAGTSPSGGSGPKGRRGSCLPYRSTFRAAIGSFTFAGAKIAVAANPRAQRVMNRAAASINQGRSLFGTGVSSC